MKKYIICFFWCFWAFPSLAQVQPVSIHIQQHPRRWVAPEYLSFALDISILLKGAQWWADEPPLDLQNSNLQILSRALGPAYLRIGGTDADKVFYAVGQFEHSKLPKGYDIQMQTQDWQNLMQFARDVNLPVMFTLNAGSGPRNHQGQWTNFQAEALIKYATQRQDPVFVWELGNEINGYPVIHNGLHVSAQQYSNDLQQARQVLQKHAPQARLAGPASAFWPVLGEPFALLPDVLRLGGSTLDIISWHYYPQQSQRCPIATRSAALQTLLEPQALESAAEIAGQIRREQMQHAIDAELWVGETGHAQCGGQAALSDRYVSSLWWMDQLGRLALEGQQVQIRQSLVGSDYGLLDPHTLQPRPDYWTSWIWKQLMGQQVLNVDHDGPQTLRAYAHCHPNHRAYTLLLINFSPQAQTIDLGSDLSQTRLYVLGASELLSREVMLNGKVLQFSGQLPALNASIPDTDTLILPPLGIAFVSRPDSQGLCQPLRFEQKSLTIKSVENADETPLSDY